MKSLPFTYPCLLVIGFAAGEFDAKTMADLPTATHSFDYDSKQPLAVHDKVIEQFDGGTLHAIASFKSSTSAAGDGAGFSSCGCDAGGG